MWTVYLSLLCFLLFWGRITGKGESITELEAILHGPVTCCPLLLVAALPCLQKLHLKGSMAQFGKSNWIEIQSLLDLDRESGIMRTQCQFCCLLRAGWKLLSVVSRQLGAGKAKRTEATCAIQAWLPEIKPQGCRRDQWFNFHQRKLLFRLYSLCLVW